MATKLSLADGLQFYGRQELDRLVAEGHAEATALMPPHYTHRERIDPQLFRRLKVVDEAAGDMAGGFWEYEDEAMALQDGFRDAQMDYLERCEAARRKGLDPSRVVEPPEPPEFIYDPDLPQLRSVSVTIKGRVATTAVRRTAQKLLEEWLLQPKPGNTDEVKRRLAENKAPLGRNAYREVLKAARENVGARIHPSWDLRRPKTTTN